MGLRLHLRADMVRVRVHRVRHRRATRARIVGWRTAATMTADLVTDALEMAIFSRRHQLLRGVIAHSDAGQPIRVRRLHRTPRRDPRPALDRLVSATDRTTPLAESVNGLYKTELIRLQGPWRHAEHVELATLTYVDWFNNRLMHSELGDIPPNEFEAQLLRSNTERNNKPPHQPGPDAKDRPVQTRPRTCAARRLMSSPARSGWTATSWAAYSCWPPACHRTGTTRWRRCWRLNGLRISEASGADIEHLNVERGHRTLRDRAQGQQASHHPARPRTARAIDLAVGEREHGPILLGAHGQRLDRYAATRM